MRLGIKSKLVLSFLLSNALLAGLMFTVSSWRFDQGFLAYVTQSEVQRMQPLINALAKNYASQLSWQPLLSDLSVWDTLVRQNRESDAGPRPRAGIGQSRPRVSEIAPPPRRNGNGNTRGRPQPGPQDVSFFDQRILLGDRDRNILIGPRGEPARNTEWVDIEWNDEIVGYLGIVPRDFLQGSLDLLFAEEQKSAYAWIAVGSLTMALVIGLILASLWLRPIRQLQLGMLKLSAGDYGQRLDITSNDELAGLARQFNMLARTLRDHRSVHGRWIADISHELRTPVAVLRGEIEALVDGIRPVNEQRMSSLHEEVLQLQALIDELHELSLSDLGALKYQKSDLDFPAFLTKLMVQFEHACDEAGLQLRYTKNPASLCIQVDERKFKQMFVNLFQNTLNYTDQPGILSVDWSVQEKDQGKELEIHWADSAPGVGADEKKRLFDRLFRAENSRSRRTGGSGLGLAIVKNIIEAHGGTIEVADSDLGGLDFTLHLPIP